MRTEHGQNLRAMRATRHIHVHVKHYDVTKIHFNAVRGQTDKALLLDIRGVGETWIPRSIVAAKSAHTALVHRNVYLKIIGQRSAGVDLLPDLPDDEDNL